MSAEVLRLDDYPEPSRRMKIPLREEVAKYMMDKMDWPEEFCMHYAEKFWYYYQAQGWKLANGNQMKDWKAAFNCNWQNPKTKEDNDLLTKHLAAQAKKTDPYVYINACLDKHKKGLYKPSKEELIGIYDFLKAEKKMILSKETWDRIVEESGNSRERGKMLAVRALFDLYINHGKTL